MAVGFIPPPDEPPSELPSPDPVPLPSVVGLGDSEDARELDCTNLAVVLDALSSDSVLEGEGDDVDLVEVSVEDGEVGEAADADETDAITDNNSSGGPH